MNRQERIQNMDKKNEYQDEGLRGNEKIEEAIFLLQAEDGIRDSLQ